MYQPLRARTLTLLAGASFLAACATNPVTGRRELSLVSEQQEIAMGQQGAEAAVQQMGVLPDSNIQRYVRGLGQQLAKASERPDLPWSFTVVDDPLVNAFALPGGPVFITRGIMTFFNSEAELIGVLGHEIGHITAKHSVRQISRQQLAQIGLIGAMIASPQLGQFANVASQGLQLLFLKYGRDDETQADDLGFKYGLGAGYDVREMASTFQTLDRIGGEDNAGPPEWASTHPDPGNRAARILERAQSAGVNLTGRTVNRDEYLRRIDGMVYGENPRQGFFENDVFYHPDLRFQVRYPNGWPRQNQTQAVLSVSPQQDAMLVLTAGSTGSPAQQLQQFLGQQGMQAGQTSSTTINGFPAAIAQFAAQTQDGQLAGIVAFIQGDGASYRLMGYTPSQRFSAYSQLFQQWIGTFARLTDQRVLSVQPARLRIQAVPRAMTLAEFNRQYPSSIPLAELALINGVAGENGTLQAGLAKRVEGGVTRR